MNVLDKYKIKLYDEKEYISLDKLIKIDKHDDYGYYFNNSLSFNNDFAYAELLGIDVNSYRNLIYYNCLITTNPTRTATFFNEFKDATKSKKILLFLLLNRYGSLQNVVKTMFNIRNKK